VPRARSEREDQRRRFVADPNALVALGVEVEQQSNPGVRSLVIRHEHPEFEGALKQGSARSRASMGREPAFASRHA